ncbi:hypothetical protein HDU85_003076 [Gaertneriomyces sp. JEL0708]|nr:hypothetical protein HDU85_003076 [Gaertneriomyces sp. JEL0708]
MAGRPRDWGMLDTLTDDADSKPAKLPKAVLPIVGKPMIHYQLQWLEAARVQDIIVLCPHNSKDEVVAEVTKYEETSDFRIQVQVLGVSHGEGTADALRSIADKIKSDFIVMSCDIITQLPPHHLIDLHRTQSPTVTTLLYDFQQLEGGAEKPCKQDAEYAQYTGIDSASGQLVFSKAQEDVGDSLRLRMSMLRKFPRIKLYTNLRDAHVYVFKRWVMDIVVADKTISSIRKDLMKYLVQCQYSHQARAKARVNQLLSANPDVFAEAELLSTTSSLGVDKLMQRMQSMHLMARDSEISNLSSSFTSDAPDPSQQVVCAGVICKETVLCARANSVWAYSEINRQLFKSLPDKAAVSSAGDLRSKLKQIGPDSMVGEGSQIADGCSVKKSIIGKHCTIGKNVRITSTVIMDYVVIEDGVKLENCVLSSHCKVLAKCNLKDCEVGPKYVVEKETTAKNEQYTESSGFLEI